MKEKLTEEELDFFIKKIGIDNTSIREVLQEVYQKGFNTAYNLF